MGIESNCDNSARPQSISRREFLKRTSATAAGLLIGCKPAQGADTTLSLINGVLIDGTGADAIPDGAVVIQDGRILATGPRPKVAIPSNANTIDIQGGTILPGFINAHVHDAYSASRLKAWAQGGVTTVRNLGKGPYTPARFEIRNALCANPKCARLVAARSCNMESELGTLEAGKLADVLVVDGDPLVDVHALTKVRLVLREGKSI